MSMIEFSEGLIKMSVEEIMELHYKVENFQEQAKKSILILFIKIADHWTLFVAKKKGAKSKLARLQDPYRTGKKFDNKYFLLDSSNIPHLDKNILHVPNIIMERVRE